ncbi:HIRAN domain-containing protein [Ammoniphilus sp. CFH 90114]|uniref:HIRAN domain-containing protein n=1 Tax=Ammoniphilus sp. CFH 90114 TaxID=2493665 RepID=UPI00100FEE4D|nr:HIRAN domain-containing protein [Ammoniphilus sp. CFH 90114]RXT02766.1 hypothetical protein EIZ39_24540 [Ammoniphilus sp. CFH 90114]
MRRIAMTLAHSIRKAKKWAMSESLRWAWKIVKNQITAKVVGVTFGNRQQALNRLCNYEPRRVVFTTRRESDNPYDSNAIAINVTVIGKGTVHIGYLPKDVAQILAPLLDKNLHPTILSWEILGEETKGIKLSMELVTGISRANQIHTATMKQPTALIAIR